MDEQPRAERIRLVLLDERGLFRESLGHLLSAEPDFEILGQCSTHSEALELSKGGPVDIFLLDLNIGGKRSEDFITAARQSGYKGRFLIVTAEVDAKQSVGVLKMGASGIFLKSNSARRFLQAIRLVASGDAWIDHSVIDLIAERYPHPKNQSMGEITVMERTVLNGLLDGLTNREIGSKAGISESAVKGVVQQLFEKAGVRKRSQLVRVVLEASLGTGKAASGEAEQPAVLHHPHVIF